MTMSRPLLALTLIGLGLPPPVAAQSRSLQLTDYYRLQTVNGTALSPDGRTVAFVKTAIVEADNRRHSEIWVAPFDGSAPPRRLTSPAFSATGPRWSPDGRLLAFTSRRPVVTATGPRDESVWFLRMDGDGGEAFQIPGVEGTPVFSPDNKWIAFTKAVPPEKTAGARNESKTEAEKRIDERFKGRVYDWMNARFDGRGYLPDPRDPQATPPEELFIVAREGGTARQLTTMGVNVQSPSWRGDSGALAFAANPYQRDEHRYERADLFTVDLAGGLKRVTDDGFDHGSPGWTASGDALIALREQSLDQILSARQQHGSPTDLYRFPLAGGSAVNLTATWDLIAGAPRTSADGRSVYFSAGGAGTTHLFRVPITGGSVQQVTTGDRRLNDISISWSAGRLAYAATTTTGPSEVFAAALDGSSERRISNVNVAFTSEVSLRPVDRVRFLSKDGTEVEGWLMMPAPSLTAAPGARVPLILAIHGGPHGSYGVDFNFLFQLMAANGFAVLYTNPRGSTEYGEKFRWATWGGWGGLDYEDVMAGVDHVLAKYPVDPRRLGVTGYSYGGFLTNWVITQTQRFAAAIVGAGISNWISDYGTADIPRTKESEFYGAPWEAKGAETLLKWSPVMRAGAVTTPTLFVHGESDLRVPIEQGEQMYTALRKRKVPARFIRYPDSYHDGWTPWNTAHRYHHELGWWRQYLAAPAEGSQ